MFATNSFCIRSYMVSSPLVCTWKEHVGHRDLHNSFAGGVGLQYLSPGRSPVGHQLSYERTFAVVWVLVHLTLLPTERIMSHRTV